MNKDFLLAFSEGRNAWMNSKLGFFLRLRGLFLTLLTSVIFLTSKPFWMDYIAFPSKKYPLENFIFSLILLLIILAIIGLFYLRKRSLRSLNIKYLLHQFTHDIRDEHTKLLQKNYNKNFDDIKKNYRSHIKIIVDYSKEYFQKITNDNTIEAALRLAKPHPFENGNVQYHTIYRTSGFNKGREETSEPISANVGVPRYLIEKHKQRKILIYNDLKKAIEHDLFLKTKSEEVYPDEIETMMVAPLNAFDGKRKSMIGILYITSRTKNVFTEKHVDLMRFIADKISDTISLSTELSKNLLKSKGGKNV